MSSKGKSQVELARLEADLAAWGFRTFIDPHTAQRKVLATCGDCGAEKSWFHGSLHEAQAAVTHYTKLGWLLKRRSSPYCSADCLRAAKAKLALSMAAEGVEGVERVEEEKSMTTIKSPSPMTATALAAALTPVPTVGPDIKLLLRVGEALTECFDKATRRYHDGWDDQRVAKHIDCSLEFVLKVRKEAFGELAEDPEIAKLRLAIEDVKKALADSKKTLDIDIRRYDTWRGEMDAKVRELDHKLARLAGVADKAKLSWPS